MDVRILCKCSTNPSVWGCTLTSINSTNPITVDDRAAAITTRCANTFHCPTPRGHPFDVEFRHSCAMT
ncbi:unnamed protein product [Lampetra planeri]